MKRFRGTLLSALSCLLALLCGILLLHDPFVGQSVSLLLAAGLDVLRAQLVAALMMTAAAALLAMFVLRKRLGAMIGASGAFFSVYLLGFLHAEQQPVYDPGGGLEPLNGAVLFHTTLLMLALALLCAFLGAAIGGALGEVLLDPPFQVAQKLWQRRQSGPSYVQAPIAPARSGRKLIFTLAGTITMLGLIVLASGSGDLFLFSPDLGLHVLPTLPNGRSYMFGTVIQDEMTSPILGGQKKAFLVYLPPSYMTAQATAKRYPTLYLLHGSPGTAIDWIKGGKADQSVNTLISLGKIADLILVLPDGNGRARAPSEWGNSFDHQQNIETSVVKELVPYVDKKYRTIADARHRAIGGLSMGGFGAANIGIHHPNIFGSIISLGGYYYAEGAIWGNKASVLQQNSPALVLPNKKEAWKLHFYLGAATKDHPYITEAKQFAQELTKLHIPYTFDLQEGYHAWRVWQVQLYHALLWLQWGG